MKQIIILFSFFFILISQADAKKIYGHIVLNNDDTLEVTLRIPTEFLSNRIDYESLQRRIRYFDENRKRRHFKPHQAKEVFFEYYGEEVRMFSHPAPNRMMNLLSFSSHVFMKLDIEGELRLFTYFSKETNDVDDDFFYGDNINEKYYLQKGNEALKNPNFFKFRKDMMNYLGDCDEMVEKLEEKDFRRWDIWEMVRFYNRVCFE